MYFYQRDRAMEFLIWAVSICTAEHADTQDQSQYCCCISNAFVVEGEHLAQQCFFPEPITPYLQDNTVALWSEYGLTHSWTEQQTISENLFLTEFPAS